MPSKSYLPVIILWVIILAVIYFVTIRPQKGKNKKLKELRDNVQVGDKVTTIGGMVAIVAKVEDETVLLEFGPSRTKVPYKKWAIGSVEPKAVKKVEDEE